VLRVSLINKTCAIVPLSLMKFYLAFFVADEQRFDEHFTVLRVSLINKTCAIVPLSLMKFCLAFVDEVLSCFLCR
jgi:hypothetical protein